MPMYETIFKYSLRNAIYTGRILYYDKGMQNEELRRHKNKARAALSYALRMGRVTKGPCRVCGRCKVQAHHKDYNRPLDVVWMCVPCHAREHFQLRANAKRPAGMPVPMSAWLLAGGKPVVKQKPVVKKRPVTGVIDRVKVGNLWVYRERK